MQIKTLLDSVNSLSEIKEKELPVVLSFKIGKLVRQIDDHLDSFYTARLKRIKELGEEIKDKNGKLTDSFKVKKINDKKWRIEYEKMLAQEVEVQVPEIRLSDLSDYKLKPSVFEYLDWLIKE